MDRNWFITVVTYGTWLPGDERGFVSHTRPNRDTGKRVIENRPQTERLADNPALKRHSAAIMTGQPIYLTLAQAEELLAQFHETAAYRKWRLWAVSIMANHFHAVVGVSGDPEPETIRGDLKSYGSRRLNRGWGKPKNGTWWADGGSNRKLATEESLLQAVRYTIDQEHPLVIWSDCIPELELPGGRIQRDE